MRYPCPLAETEQCKLTFTTLQAARVHSRLQTHPFICPRREYYERFATLEEVSKHENDPLHKALDFYVCPLPGCRNAVSGFQQPKPSVRVHRNRHVFYGEIEQGKRPGSDLVVLDDEFSPASRQLWEFAIIERISGNVLINTCVAHEDGLDHESAGGNSFLRHMSHIKAVTVYDSTRTAIVGRLKADKIAFRLKEVGITQETIFLVWHKSKSDLTILRNLLESAGHSGILPPDENCIPKVQPFQRNVRVAPPGYNSFPLKLEILFPTLDPLHGLRGMNHRALEDAQQTRLVCMAFDELCKPLSQRSAEWQPDTVANTAQKPLLSWVQEEPPADKAEGESNRLEKY